LNGWTKPKGGARYADVSERTFRKLLKQGLKHSRLPSGTILVSFDAIDEFLASFEVDSGREVDRIVDEVVQEMSR
jgi:hypothetical protein